MNVPTPPGRGRRLGVDVGSVRVGVALCDPDCLLATPLETVARDERNGTDLHRLGALVAEHDAVEVVVGLPRSLSGAEGAAAALARGFAVRLADVLDGVPVRLVDERFTTVTAHRNLRDAGVRGRRRKPVVDQAAAVLILQAAIDADRTSSVPVGSYVVPDAAARPDGPAPQRTEADGRE
ncbi:MAG: Holliday junction resolvase RuvX [Kineosporiaceae bacterium]